jgi:hypothetical protein
MHPTAATHAAIDARPLCLRMVPPHMTESRTIASPESATVPFPETVAPPTADALPLERVVTERLVNAQYARSGSTT